MVTGKPAIASKIASKSACCTGSSRSSAARRAVLVGGEDHLLHDGEPIGRHERARCGRDRCPPRRTRGPSRRPRACRRSRARAGGRRRPSRGSSRSSGRSSGTSGTAPTITRPVPPSIVSWSPSRSSTSPIRTVRAAGRWRACRSPRRTACPCPSPTAACDVIPRARSAPHTSGSGRGCRRGRLPADEQDVLPLRPRASARSASSTIAPEAAPGDAFNPVAITSTAAFGSIIGWSS